MAEAKAELGAFAGLDRALKLLIKKSGRKQREIAERTGVARPTISRIVNGHDRPSIETLGRLLGDGLGLTVLDLAEALIEVNRDSPLPEVVPRSELQAALRVLHLRLQVDQPSPQRPSSPARKPRKA